MGLNSLMAAGAATQEVGGAAAGTLALTGVGLPLAAIIGAGSSIIGGIMQWVATDQTNKANKKIYDQERQDQLAGQKWNQNMATRQQAFNELQARLDRQDAQDKTNYAKQQNAYQRVTDLLTQQMNANQLPMNAFSKRK
jgi:hypothetical protein